MNIQAAYRYQLTDQKKSVLIYYFVHFCIFILLYSSMAIKVSGDVFAVSGQFNGMGFATAIFIFVTGLCSFKEEFGMLMQNGISRKTMFAGRLLTSVSLALGMSIVDELIVFIYKTTANFSKGALSSSSFYEQLYFGANQGYGDIKLYAVSILFDFFLYLCFISLGYLITNIFYRLSKGGRVALSVSLPVGIFVVLPIYDYAVAGGRITTDIIRFVSFSFGIAARQPARAMFTCTAAFLIFSCLSWLLIRRADIKE